MSMPGPRSAAVAWARKLIVLSAVSEIRPQLRASMLRTPARDYFAPPLELGRQIITKRDLERALLAIDVFPRCALLLTVFEGWSLGDTAVVLGAEWESVRAAQIEGEIELAGNKACDELSSGQPDKQELSFVKAAGLTAGDCAAHPAPCPFRPAQLLKPFPLAGTAAAFPSS